MKPELIIHSDLLDILFENRNKEYGAYELRKQYQKRLLSAVCSTVLIVLLGVVILKSIPHKRMMKLVAYTSKDTLKLFPIPPHKEPLSPEPPVAKPKTATIDNATYVIVPNEDADTIPTIDELITSTARIDVVTTVGPPVENSVMPVEGSGNGTVPQTPAKVEEPEPGILERAEFMPQYPGGVEALRRFLGKNLRVPEEELEPGQRVRIDVRFVVDSTGMISGVEFPAHRSAALEKEVKRVIGKMSQWTPGSHNGKKVNVHFSIPVIFEIPE